MARTATNTKLDTRTARRPLKVRKMPYWTPLSPGHTLGYRKGSKGGKWLAKMTIDGLRKEQSLGVADDILDADGVTVLSFSQAQEKARKWFVEAKQADHGINLADLIVDDAIEDYLTAYKKKGKSLDRMNYSINAYIRPAFSKEKVTKLTKRKIEKWHLDVSETLPRLRTRKGHEQKYRDISADPEATRRRQVTANRMLTILKAILNHAANEYPALSDDAWRRVKVFKDAEVARVRYLSDKEAQRLVNAAEEPFRSIVVAGLLTGCRYGELVNLQAADYNPDAGTIHIRISKSGKPRHVVLTDEGQQHFERAAAGKGGDDLLFKTPNGNQWGRSHQHRPIALACENGKIVPAISFHILRHTYASRLVMQGVDLIVVAKQLGHSDTRMVEKHYGHLAPSYVADTVRNAFTNMGLVSQDNIVSLNSA